MMTEEPSVEEPDFPVFGDPERRNAVLALVGEARNLVSDINAKMAEIQSLLADEDGDGPRES